MNMTDTITIKRKRIRAKLGFQNIKDSAFIERLEAIRDGMTGNLNFPDNPVDMATFGGAIETFKLLMAEAKEDRGKRAIEAKYAQRTELIRMARWIGHYVESTAGDKPEVFKTSGFIAASGVRTPPQPLAAATFKYVDRGPTDRTLRVKVATIAGAVAYEVRYARVLDDDALTPWTHLTLSGSKAITIDNLALGTTYAFQVRAMNALGYTEWSGLTTCMCSSVRVNVLRNNRQK